VKRLDEGWLFKPWLVEYLTWGLVSICLLGAVVVIIEVYRQLGRSEPVSSQDNKVPPQ
jgi:hypothetical protein